MILTPIMLISAEEVEKLIESIKHANINIKETILLTISQERLQEWLFKECFVMDSYGVPLTDLLKSEGFGYEFLSDTYWDYLEKLIDGEGAYIALCFISEGGFSGSETIPFNVEGLTEDEIFHYGLETWMHRCSLAYPEELFIPPDEGLELGILVNRNEDKFEITFVYNEKVYSGPGYYYEIRSIENELDNPIFRMAIILMCFAIVLNA